MRSCLKMSLMGLCGLGALVVDPGAGLAQSLAVSYAGPTHDIAADSSDGTAQSAPEGVGAGYGINPRALPAGSDQPGAPAPARRSAYRLESISSSDGPDGLGNDRLEGHRLTAPTAIDADLVRAVVMGQGASRGVLIITSSGDSRSTTSRVGSSLVFQHPGNSGASSSSANAGSGGGYAVQSSGVPVPSPGTTTVTVSGR